jgi:hypothetical protein
MLFSTPFDVRLQKLGDAIRRVYDFDAKAPVIQ